MAQFDQIIHSLEQQLASDYQSAARQARELARDPALDDSQRLSLVVIAAYGDFLSGALRQALTRLTQASVGQSGNDELIALKLATARVLTELGEYEQASTQVDQASHLSTQDRQDIILAQARLQLHTGQAEETRTLLTLASNPSQGLQACETELLLGWSITDWRLADAINHLETAVALADDYPLIQVEALLILAECHLRCDQPEKAQAVAKQFESIAVPELRDADILRLQAKLTMLSGESTAGMNTYQLAIAQAEAHERFEYARSLYLELANLLEANACHEDALEAMRIAQHMSERQVAQSIRTREILSQTSHSIERLRQAYHAEKQAHDELKATHKRISAVLGLARGLTGTLDVDSLLHHTYHAISPHLPGDGFMIALYNEQDEQLDLPFVMQRGQLQPPYSIPLSQRSDYVVACYSQQTTIVEDDAIDYSQDSEVRALIFVPLVNRDECLGVISIQSSQPYAYDQADVELVEALAGFIAAALANALRHQAIQSLNQALEAEKQALDNAHARIEHLAFHDQLTELPNRRLLQQRGERLIDGEQSFEVAYIDLDDFKPINDEYGHETGDLLLKVLAGRMRRVASERDIMIARIGGDEFVALLGGHDNDDTIAALADALKAPIELPQVTVAISASIGVARFGRDGKTLPRLLAEADRALYQAKASRKAASPDDSLTTQYTEQLTK